MIGPIVTVTVDRPLGSFHPEHPDIHYPINYGYIKGTMATGASTCQGRWHGGAVTEG